MKKIIYTNNEGVLCVLTPAPKENVGLFIHDVLGMTDDEYLDFIKNKDVPADATNVHIVDELTIPTDRSFRNAWIHDDANLGSITHDMNKCVDITSERLRNERAPLLEALDVQYMKALEQGADTTQIVNEKQRLRDITTIPNASMTLDELKAIKAEPTV